MVISKNCNIKVVLSDKFHKKINWLVKNWDVEIGGFITGNWDNNGIYVDDLLIFKQKVHSTNVTKLAIADILLINEVGVEITNKIIGEWHSHNIMNTFWSATDEEFIKSHLTNENGEIIKNSMLSIVSAYHKNKAEKFDHKVRIDIKGFKGMNATFDDLEYSVGEIKDENILKIFKNREKIILSAENRIKPLKDKIDEILKKTQEKIMVLKDSVEKIEEEEVEELGKFLKKEIKNKVEKETIEFNYSKNFQQSLNDIEKIKINNKNKTIENKYLDCKKNKSIIIKDIDEWINNSIIYFLEEEEKFNNLNIVSEESDKKGKFEILIKDFLGKKQYKKLKMFLIDKLIYLDNENIGYNDVLFNGYNDETDNFNNYDKVNKSLDDEIMSGRYNDYVEYGGSMYD